ncbi:unnamed protein product [Prunus armeniaca]
MKVSLGLLQLVFGKHYALIAILLPAPPFCLLVPFRHLIWPTYSLVSFSGLIERFQSMRNAIFLLICWDLDRIKVHTSQA